MQGALRVVDFVAFAQGIEAVALARMQFLGHAQGGGNARTSSSVRSAAGVLLGLAVSLFPGPALAEETPAETAYFVADIELQTAQEFGQLLDRAEQLMDEGDSLPPVDGNDAAIVTLVLHGPVLKNLLRENYRENKTLVDQAASLSVGSSTRFERR